MDKMNHIQATNHVGTDMFGEKGTKGVGTEAGRMLAEILAAENARPPATFAEAAWRRFSSPERRRQAAAEAKKAALAAARCEP